MCENSWKTNSTEPFGSTSPNSSLFSPASHSQGHTHSTPSAARSRYLYVHEFWAFYLHIILFKHQLRTSPPSWSPPRVPFFSTEPLHHRSRRPSTRVNMAPPSGERATDRHAGVKRPRMSRFPLLSRYSRSGGFPRARCRFCLEETDVCGRPPTSLCPFFAERRLV